MTINFILYAMCFSAILGAVLGRIYTYFIPDLDYQLLPTWLFAGILSCIISLVASGGLILVFGHYITTNFTQLVAINAVVSTLLLLWMMYKSIPK